MKTKTTLFLLLFFVCSINLFAQKKLIGKVVRIYDGDTITVLDSNNREFQIRLAGIDAPELRQEFGQKAKYNLANLVFGKEVVILYQKTDKYGRIVGKVILNDVDICLRQVKDGFAWHYKEYANEQSENDRKLYADAEIKAKEGKLGLWIQPALYPQEWRAKKSANGNESPTPMPEHSSPQTSYPNTPSSTVNTTTTDPNLQKGSRGGCFYKNANGNKTYVDRSKCN